ncbi:class III signal peptide-containing protein [Methanothermobacter sp. THM-2]|uniref:class III signal peptide-containing protein n=1 Tax=Methanothermobacter sp. THM-2 TaxID=2606912 RepID=UPI00136631E2|nr:class III signal peptide-containing protein [Methanothermobacter sp. THM-2]
MIGGDVTGLASLVVDEEGQGAAEYILLLGGVIVISIVAILIYRSYFQRSALNSAQDIQDVRKNINGSDAAKNASANNSTSPGPVPEPKPIEPPGKPIKPPVVPPVEPNPTI